MLTITGTNGPIQEPLRCSQWSSVPGWELTLMSGEGSLVPKDWCRINSKIRTQRSYLEKNDWRKNSAFAGSVCARLNLTGGMTVGFETYMYRK